MPTEFHSATPRVAAGVLYRDAEGRVLLVKPVYKDGWDIPGGYAEPGESPKDAAAREVAEELGIQEPIGELLVVDWAPHPEEGDKILFVFDGGQVARNIADLKLQAAEIERAELVDLAEAANRLPARLHRRLVSAVEATGPHYLEHGEPA